MDLNVLINETCELYKPFNESWCDIKYFKRPPIKMMALLVGKMNNVYGFGQNVFSQDQLNGILPERDDKFNFFTTLIKYTEILVGKKIDADARDISAGREVEKTLILLQHILEASKHPKIPFKEAALKILDKNYSIPDYERKNEIIRTKPLLNQLIVHSTSKREMAPISNFIVDLDDYTISNKDLGDGSFGKVTLIEDKKTKHKYAAKISKKDVSSAQEQKLFFSEIEILIRVENPAILNLTGFNMKDFNSNSNPVIITEYLENGSLSNILNLESNGLAPHEWTPTKKLITILGIAFGMKYLHSKGIIHRDLKPGNVLMDSNYYPRIGDFGISKIFDSESMEASTQIGTAMYMAPEIIRGEKYSKSVDVFAYSFIVYEILTGVVPMTGSNCFHLVMMIEKGGRPEKKYLPMKDQKDFLEHMWNDDPQKRYTFDDIVSLLIGKVKSNEINSIFSEDIDEDEVIDYISTFYQT
ncbi:hypothetical protein TRFO_27871 [Tritrichomonas foetus]|uniref:Protein kinase domain-containing protein n=1 Tax=Tritrichomonas foetus TaxID=1144522 RepID=A0A1J4K4B9_9EUKA|nr:hypothetical protein TRFO_27871 [Tritrichomonas foetus]|eukprot:OHT04604.1 hypothetical protein TRFO_27871 [Tritrichomonas foetus]